MNPRSSRLLLPGMLLAGLLLAAGCTGYLPTLLPPAAYPEINPARDPVLPGIPTHSFSFEDFPVNISSPAGMEAYPGARSAKKEVRIFDPSIQDAEWRSGLYLAMTTDPAQDLFYDGLSADLREVRDLHDLDTDEYLELMAVFVQSIPYRNQNLTSPKYPIETYVDREGDCDDKSMLLAGLLAHEGYRVALLHFGPEQHMAVGVGCAGEGYRDTGYAFIETTRVSLVGIESESLAGNITLVSDPLVIPVGSGTLAYSRCSETLAIYAELAALNSELEELRAGIRDREADLRSRRLSLVGMEEGMDRLREAGDLAEYNRMVVQYNQYVRDYNRDLEQYNALTAEYTRLADRHNYIIGHEHDREGTYRMLFQAGS